VDYSLSSWDFGLHYLSCSYHYFLDFVGYPLPKVWVLVTIVIGVSLILLSLLLLLVWWGRSVLLKKKQFQLGRRGLEQMKINDVKGNGGENCPCGEQGMGSMGLNLGKKQTSGC